MYDSTVDSKQIMNRVRTVDCKQIMNRDMYSFNPTKNEQGGTIVYGSRHTVQNCLTLVEHTCITGSYNMKFITPVYITVNDTFISLQII